MNGWPDPADVWPSAPAPASGTEPPLDRESLTRLRDWVLAQRDAALEFTKRHGTQHSLRYAIMMTDVGMALFEMINRVPQRPYTITTLPEPELPAVSGLHVRRAPRPIIDGGIIQL